VSAQPVINDLLQRPLTLAEVNAAILHQQRNRIKQYYPETGPLRRELYRKHMEFFRAGATMRERLMMAANRVGKSEGVGAYETTLHLTGKYPPWWEGKRFNSPISAWVAGDTNQTVRDILQAKLLGKLVREPGDNPNQAVGLGTGMIPWDAIKSVKPKAGGIPNAIESALIKHVSGGVSELTFKSYEQGRESFQGTEKHLVWLDEEPPLDVYLECLVRTMQTTMFPGGLLILTFTPLNGWTDVVERFMDEKACAEAGRFMVQAGWDDAPHLSDAEKAAMLAALPPHQRDARSKGIPQLGAGAIYPVEESALIVQPFEIPPHWPRVFGMDVGWNWTAGVHAAWDRENDIVYLYAEYLRSEGEPSIHAAAIKSRGAWIPGVIDPAANGRSQVDGRQLLEMYKALGLDLEAADNAVESGIYEVWTRMSSGRLKVFASCQQWLEEFRLYRRDAKGRVVKKRDHLQDCTRYIVKSGLGRAKTEPVAKPKRPRVYDPARMAGSWMS